VYNATVPSQLKAWIDRLVVPRKTIRYGENGPEGLAGGKRVIVALARGGFSGHGSGAVSAEHAESYLRTVLAVMGIPNPEFVLAEGLATGEHNKTQALVSAREAVQKLAA
jgi:FMN-dependent NADH-azoreductase